MSLMRWTTDGSSWQLDIESPLTTEGTARPVPLDPLPNLGLTRGARLTRTKQLDFMHRFMSSPLVPSLCNGRFFMSHVHLKHLTEKWSAHISEQFDMQKLISFIKEDSSKEKGDRSWPKFILDRMKEITTLGFGTELQIAPSSMLLFETFDVNRMDKRGKAIFQHKFEKHSLTMEAVWPALFTDKTGSYFTSPLLLGLDLASIGSKSGLSYHLCFHHLNGDPNPTLNTHSNPTLNPNPNPNSNSNPTGELKSSVPLALFPGFYGKLGVSFKKKYDFWGGKEKKVKMVQPYDLFLSDPHISGSWTIGGVASSSITGSSSNTSNSPNSFKLHTQKDNFALGGDLFGSLALTAQHGTFQKLFFDLSRLSARLDFNSGSDFLTGATRLGKSLYRSALDFEAVRAVCPDVIVSLQQQIVGPFSFRVDSKVNIDPTNKNQIACVEDSVFAIDWALQVLGSAKATAWFSPKRQEGMVELRFFET